MATNQAFTNELYNKVRTAIINLKEEELSDIYVLSFYYHNADDDPRYPVLTVGYNTISRWAACTPAAGQPPKWPIASDEEEAKWNFAFWLQNEELVVGGFRDEFVAGWVRTLPFYYTDEESEEDEEKTIEAGNQIRELFQNNVVVVAQQLHANGVIREKFDKAIPIIIHELEYYDLPLNLTKQGNPEGLVKEFEAWIQAM